MNELKFRHSLLFALADAATAAAPKDVNEPIEPMKFAEDAGLPHLRTWIEPAVRWMADLGFVQLIPDIPTVGRAFRPLGLVVTKAGLAEAKRQGGR